MTRPVDPAHTLSDEQLLDLAAEYQSDPDALGTEYLSAILRIAVERLEPQLRDREAEIARLKRELNDVRNQLEVNQGVSAALERARRMARDEQAITARIRQVVRAAKATGKAVVAP